MENYLAELINRMNDNSDMPLPAGKSSADTISWKAIREAEKIDDVAYIPPLMAFINMEKDINKRDRAYFILGHIAKNTGDMDAAVFLINRVGKEKQRYVLSSLLDRISNLKKPAGTDLSPLINATGNDAWDIRQSAIKALSLAEGKEAEETLLRIIETSHSEYDLLYANNALSTSGSSNSIPALMKLLGHKKQDVSGTALYAILKLSGPEMLPLFLEQLEHGRNKFTALYGVIRYGDAKVVPNVVKRVNQLVAKQRAIEAIGTGGKTEIIVALEFLVKYAQEEPSIRKLYELLRHKKYSLLWDSEKKWLADYRKHFE